MQFTWIDYPGQYETELEHWCDETVRYAIDAESIKEEHGWYANHHTLGKDYFCKVVLDCEAVVALFMVRIDKAKTPCHENVVFLDTLIINPALRHQGYATRIITELIQHTKNIIPLNNNIFVAQIHKDNEFSKKLAAKLNFHFIYTDAEANDDWFDWVYPAKAAGRYLALRDG